MICSCEGTVQYNVRKQTLPYSKKQLFSLGENFRDFRGQTCFCINKNQVKLTKTEIDDVIMCLHRLIQTSAQSVCALNGGP